VRRVKSDPVEHRSFILTLDTTDGDILASEAGLTPASEDVFELECVSAAKDWAIMQGEGMLPQLLQYAEWFADIAVPPEATSMERQMFLQSSVTFAAAAIARLKNNGYLQTPPSRRITAVAIKPSTGEVFDRSVLPEDLLDLAADLYADGVGEGGSDEYWS